MKWRRSLSGRLLGLFLATALLLILVVLGGFRYGLQGEWRQALMPHLREYATHLRQQIGDPPQVARARALVQRLPIDIRIAGPDGDWQSSDQRPPLSRYRFFSEWLADGRRLEIGWWRRHYLLRWRSGDTLVELWPGLPEAGDRGNGLWARLATLFGVLLVLLLFYYAVRRLFRPIEVLRQGIARFGQGELEHRIRLARRDELGELGDSIDRMADDIQGMLEAKRQLLLAISHELRSPLTRARIQLELLDDSEGKELLAGELNEIERLLNELLESERLNGHSGVLDRRAVAPARLIDGVLERYPEVVRHLSEPEVYLSLDAARIRLLIRNLLENALAHTPEGAAPPEIDSRYDAGHWLLEVRDHGRGIAAEHLPHLTDPFYRADPSRRRQTGGFGLGLYLCRQIAEAHGGDLEIRSALGRGTQVRVRIPVMQVDGRSRGGDRYRNEPSAVP